MVNIFLLIIRKGISFKFRLGSVRRRLRPDIKRDSLLLQHTMCQRKIVSSVRCGRLNRENIPMDLLQIWYGTVVWYPVKEIQSQIPPQSHICLDTLFDLPFRWDSVQISYQQIFYQHNRVNCWAAISVVVQMGCFFTDEGQVQCGFQFPQKVSLWDQIFYRYHVQLQLHFHPSLRFLSHYIIFPVMSTAPPCPDRVSKRAVKRNQRENRVPRSPDGWNNSGLYEFQNGCKPARTQSKQPGDFPAFAENIDFSAPVSEYNGADQR